MLTAGLQADEFRCMKAAEFEFTLFDVDGDKKITKAEWIKRYGTDEGFDAYDLDKDGIIDPSEFIQMKAKQYNLEHIVVHEESKSLMQSLHDGEIDQVGWCKLFGSDVAFSDYDKNNDGVIGLDEIDAARQAEHGYYGGWPQEETVQPTEQTALESGLCAVALDQAGLCEAADEVRGWIAMLEGNRDSDTDLENAAQAALDLATQLRLDGKIVEAESVDKLAALLNSAVKPDARPHVIDSSEVLAKAVKKTVDRAKAKFDELDINNDGVLKGEELTALGEWVWQTMNPTSALSDIDAHIASHNTATRVLGDADQDGDCCMSFEEFATWFEEYTQALQAIQVADAGPKISESEWYSRYRTMNGYSDYIRCGDVLSQTEYNACRAQGMSFGLEMRKPHDTNIPFGPIVTSPSDEALKDGLMKEFIECQRSPVPKQMVGVHKAQLQMLQRCQLNVVPRRQQLGLTVLPLSSPTCIVAIPRHFSWWNVVDLCGCQAVTEELYDFASVALDVIRSPLWKDEVIMRRAMLHLFQTTGPRTQTCSKTSI